MTKLFKAVLGLRKLNPAAKVIRAQGICDAMQVSPYFPQSSLSIPYSTIQSAIDTLSAAIRAANAETGSAADTRRMHDREAALMLIFRQLGAFVEYIASHSSDPATVISSASMRISVPNGPAGVSELHPEAIGNGKIRVRVPRAEGEGAFIFETSTDGSTWTEAASSTLSKIVLSGFSPGTMIHIRYCAIGRDGKGPKSQAKWVMAI